MYTFLCIDISINTFHVTLMIPLKGIHFTRVVPGFPMKNWHIFHLGFSTHPKRWGFEIVRHTPRTLQVPGGGAWGLRIATVRGGLVSFVTTTPKTTNSREHPIPI